jgi:hypothetical protein
MPVANPKNLLSNKIIKRTPTSPPTISSTSKPSYSTIHKSKGKYPIGTKESRINNPINPSNLSYPSMLSSLKEPLPSSPKPPLTVSTKKTIQYFPQSYIEISLKYSTVVFQIYYTKDSPHISRK